MSKPKIEPRNLTAQLNYIAYGNSPNTHPSTAVSNAFPGLEMDFRNAFRRVFKGIVLHESSNMVMEVTDIKYKHLIKKYTLTKIGDTPVTVNIVGPETVGGKNVVLETGFALEWSNLFADIIHKAGSIVKCTFQRNNSTKHVEVDLQVNEFFEKNTAAISKEMVQPGELTQSLCSPWQNDYRECACYYWAASRPDFINTETSSNGKTIGQNWLLKDRKPGTPKEYTTDINVLVSYRELFEGWQKHLSFILEGKDIPEKKKVKGKK